MSIMHTDNWNGQRTGIDMEKYTGKDEKDDKKNVHVEQLLTTLDAEQWKSLSHIRNAAYPMTLGDKRKLLSKMMVI